MKPSFDTLMNIEKHAKRFEYGFDIFDVSIWYGCGMFRIELIGGWDEEYEVPEYGFGTGFGKDYYYGGFYQAVNVALEDIKNSNVKPEVKEAAKCALTLTCMKFLLQHNKKGE